MYTDPSEDIQSIVDQVADFVDEELIPLETDWLADEFDDFEAVIEEKRELVREMNLWTPHLSEQWGGCGLSLQEFAMIAEQLGRSPFGHYVFNCQAPDAGNMEVLIEHWMETRAERDGDDYVIDGRKWFTSGADGAEFAIVMAVTDPDADSRYAQASQIIVPTDHPRFKLVRNISVMGDTGDGYFTHGE
ncbi:MAG: acyl-CoA dehydrogenase family protein, partial [Bradymonadaceae bacterium]